MAAVARHIPHESHLTATRLLLLSFGRKKELAAAMQKLALERLRIFGGNAAIDPAVRAEPGLIGEEGEDRDGQDRRGLGERRLHSLFERHGHPLILGVTTGEQ